MKSFRKFYLYSILSIFCFSLIGCGGSGGNGTLAIGLTDQVNENYQAVYVTVSDVQVHQIGQPEDSEMGWVSLDDFVGPRTINLLELRDSVAMTLGQVLLPEGSYSQIRLLLTSQPDDGSNIQCLPHPFANYVIDGNGDVFEIKVPSGLQSGLKIVCQGKCVVQPNLTTNIVLDFDAEKSVVVAGNSGNINLKPTIKVLGTESYSIVHGTVTDAGTLEDLPGTQVSAQVFNPGAPDVQDEVSVIASTLSDLSGDYRLFLPPADYNLVAFHQGYFPEGMNLLTLPGDVILQDIQLTEASPATGNLTGTLSITEPFFANISVRQEIMVSGNPEIVELASFNLQNGESYDLNVPVGNFEIVASTCGEPTQVPPGPISVNQGEDTVVNIVF